MWRNFIRLFDKSFITNIRMSKPGFFYAVRKGRQPGIYHTWPECQEQVKGFPWASFKKFPTEEEAQAFINQTSSGSKRQIHTSSEKSEEKTKRAKVDEKSDEDSEEEKVDKEDKKKSKAAKIDDKAGDYTGESFDDEDGTSVYTDGGCFFNGMHGAKAGIGVFWGKDDPDNVSERLPGKPTNNRAEIHAAICAIQSAKKKDIKNLILHTDSQFLINGATKWMKGWKKNGWINSSKKTVINKEDFEKLDGELEGINIKWVHVKGHTGDPSNEAVDSLAKAGAKKEEPEEPVSW